MCSNNDLTKNSLFFQYPQIILPAPPSKSSSTSSTIVTSTSSGPPSSSTSSSRSQTPIRLPYGPNNPPTPQEVAFAQKLLNRIEDLKGTQFAQILREINSSAMKTSKFAS